MCRQRLFFPPCYSNRDSPCLGLIASGDMNDGELRDIAAIRESAMYRDEPQRILPLINNLFQTTL